MRKEFNTEINWTLQLHICYYHSSSQFILKRINIYQNENEINLYECISFQQLLKVCVKITSIRTTVRDAYTHTAFSEKKPCVLWQHFWKYPRKIYARRERGAWIFQSFLSRDREEGYMCCPLQRTKVLQCNACIYTQHAWAAISRQLGEPQGVIRHFIGTFIRKTSKHLRLDALATSRQRPCIAVQYKYASLVIWWTLCGAGEKNSH